MPGRVLPLLLIAALTGGAAAAHAGTGRTIFPLRAPVTVDDVVPRGLDEGVALADGSVILAGPGRGAAIALAKLRRDGSLDPSFGDDGVTELPVATDPAMIGTTVEQVLSGPNGTTYVVADGPARTKYELQQLQVVRITADGHLDPAFGAGGVVEPGIEGSCGGCAPAAVMPDGGLVVTGNTGGFSPEVETNPNAADDMRWVIARLTAAGARDPAFGDAGLVTLSEPGGNGGTGVVAEPGGDLAVLGLTGRGSGGVLRRLTPSGAPAPGYNGEVPIVLGGSAFALAPRGDDGVTVLMSRGSLLRFDASGTQTLRVSVAGAAVLPGLAGSDVVIGRVDPNSTAQVVERITTVAADGTTTLRQSVPLPYGGGYASAFIVHRAPAVSPLAQTGLRPGLPVRRDDGSWVVPGALAVIQYTGEGTGFLRESAAASSLTADLRLDTTFGPAPPPARFAMALARQRARTVLSRRFIALNAQVSGPGLCLLTVRAGRSVIARSTAPVLAGGAQLLRVYPTLAGRRILARSRPLTVSVAGRFRDLWAGEATATVRGVLRGSR